MLARIGLILRGYDSVSCLPSAFGRIKFDCLRNQMRISIFEIDQTSR